LNYATISYKWLKAFKPSQILNERTFKIENTARCWWLMPVIIMVEAEIRRIMV
jgi:hypothetical protein